MRFMLWAYTLYSFLCKPILSQKTMAMATKKRTGNKEDEAFYDDRQRNSGYSNNNDRYTREGSDWRGYDDESPKGRYGRVEQYIDRHDYRRDDPDDYDYRGRNFNWRHEDDRRGGPDFEKRSGYYPAGVQGNRNESRGEGFGGYGRQGEYGSNRAGERFDDDDRFYRDRGYARDMYARNDRSYRWDDNDRRYREEKYGRQDWHNDRFNDDWRMNRDDYENRDRDQSFFGGSRAGQAYSHGARSGYGYDEFPGRQRQGNRNDRSENNEGQRRQRVVGRGMYGNHPSGRYGNYGDDTMHGNMGGGNWRGNNEYQVGGGAGYQPSDAGTYGSYSGAGETWDEDQPPGRKIGAKGNEGSRSKQSQRNMDQASKKNQGSLSAGKKVTSSKKSMKDTQGTPGRGGKKENKNTTM